MPPILRAKASPNALLKLPPVATAPAPADEKSAFVKTVHDEACAIFGMMLGPAANEAHKDHFHLDMKARKRRALCE